MKKYELKPCPVCGAKAELIDESGVGLIKCTNGCNFLRRIRVYIEYCDLEDYYYMYPFAFGDHIRTRKKEAVAEWNAFEAPKGEAGTTTIIP